MTPRLLPAVLLSALLPTLSVAQTTHPQLPTLTQDGVGGSVTGRVVLPDGQPAEYVAVAVKGTTLGTSTAADGRFRLRLPAGGQTLVIASLGRTAQELTVDVRTGVTTTLPLITLAVSANQLGEVVVTEQRGLNQQPVSIGKLAVRPLDLPQSTVTIDRQVLDQQQVLRLSDALANVSGVYVMGTTGGTQEELASRGFALGSNNTFKNGVRYNNGVPPEVTGLEKFEVLKGSAAILYGNVAAGGIVNLVTKKPRFEPGGQVGMRAGSYDFYKPFVDVYGAVNNSERVAYRVNGTYENARSFRQGVSSERVYVNPSLLFKVGAKTDLLVEGDYLRDTRTPDYGIGTINYQIVDGPRSYYLGAPWASSNTTQRSLTTTLTTRLSDAWQLRGVAAYQGYANDQLSTSRPIGVLTNGDWKRNAQRSGTEQDYFLGEVNLTGKLQTGFLGHTLLVGADADKYNTTTISYVTAAYDTINILDPSRRAPRTAVPELALNARNHAPIRRVGAYAQDLISLGERVKLLAGVRYSYQETGTKSLTYKDNATKESKRYDDAFSPRVGLVYQPVPTTALFASCANSFALNTGTDPTGAALPPSVYNQYEVGLKNDLFQGLLSANVTAYHIVNSNQAQTIQPTDARFNKDFPSAQELAGEVTSKGVELDVLSKTYRGWRFIAGYSYNHTAYTRSNTYRVGDLLRYNPNHTANLSAYYTLDHGALRGLQVGALAYYMGQRQAGRNNRLTVQNDAFRLIALPAYAQLDLSVGYALQRLTLRVKLTNALNELSYNAHDDNSINPIAPRQVAATLTYQLW